jgi:aminoglycoside phosphotransferase (APT) family kinase protein
MTRRVPDAGDVTPFPPAPSPSDGLHQRPPLRKLAEGRQAEVFAWDTGTVLRLLRSADGDGENERQRAAMSAARRCGVRTPAVYDTVTVAGRSGLLLERIEGPDLLTLLGRRPWQVLAVAQQCATLQARLHTVPAPAMLPALGQALRAQIAGSSLVPADAAAFALGLLDTLPDGDRLCHGDFHPGNVLRSARGPVVIDWPAATSGNPDADLARTALLLRLGEPPPGAPLTLRLLASLGRRVLLAATLHAYHQRRAVDRERLARWEVVQAVQRLTVAIGRERAALLRLIEQHRRGLRHSSDGRMQ